MKIHCPDRSDAWKAAADERIARHRQGEFTLRVQDAFGRPLAGVPVEVRLARHHFKWGMAVASSLLGGEGEDSRRYEEFVTAHFNTVVCENEMKWYAIEPEADARDFELADRFSTFAQLHRLHARGHCLLWDKLWWVQPWLRGLPADELRRRTLAHVREVVSRYRGQMIAWDVNNEMLDGGFYEGRLGPGTNAEVFRVAASLDPHTPLYLNEYTVLEDDARLDRYLRLLEHLRSLGAPIGGLGIQEHDADKFLTAADRPGHDFWRLGFNDGQLLVADEVYGRLDKLARASGLPLQITEVTSPAADDERRARTLADFMRLCFSHPAVDAFLLWGFWANRHFRGRAAALVDAQWNVLPAGREVARLLTEEWTTRASLMTDERGAAVFRGYYGDYEVRPAAGAGRPATVELWPGRTTATAAV